jgi:carbonic anhydrase
MISRMMKLRIVTLIMLVCASLPLKAAAAVSPDEAITRLKEGNHRYVIGKSAYPRVDPELRRKRAVYGQVPIAAVLGCADARVPPEIVFDQPFGDLFVVRVAGNVSGTLELASLEYAVAVLKVPLIVVLGHTKCGAVQAAVDNKPLPGSLPELISCIRPAVEHVEKVQSDGKKDLLLRATEQNILNQEKAMLDKSEIVRSAVSNGQIKIVGAIREITDGHIDWLPMPTETASK